MVLFYLLMFVFIFFFKQKTAYEMRISDWSSDVCSSDLVYPNGSGDVNNFHAAGGISYVIRELLGNGLLHGDIPTVARRGLADYGQEPVLENEALTWKEVPESRDESILRPVASPFRPDGGMEQLRT